MEAIFFAVVLFTAFTTLAAAFFYAIVRAYAGPKAARWAAVIVVGFLVLLGLVVGWWVGRVG